jgi:copper chaperone CopZ
MIQFIHQIPGRLRVRIPGLKASGSVAGKVQIALSRISGVNAADINLLTGSVVILYDDQAATLDAIIGVLGVWAFHTRQSEGLGGKAAKMVMSHVLEAAIERLVMASLAALL